MLPRFRRFPWVFLKKRLELKSLKGQTKTEEEGTPGPFLLSLRLSLKAELSIGTVGAYLVELKW